MYRSTARAFVAGSFALLLVACGGDGGGTTSPPASPSATTTSEAPSDLDVTTLDYTDALLTVDDLNGLLPGTYHTADEGDLKGLRLRAQCGKDGPEPGADAGLLLELQDETPSYSVTTSVQAFADAADAADAFGTLKETDKLCVSYVSDGDTFERITAPPIQPAGDDSFSQYVQKPDTGLIVADHFVLRGQFVFDVRWAIDQNSTMNTGISGVVTDQAVKKFIAWTDEQL